MRNLEKKDIGQVKFDEGTGLVPGIIQDYFTQKVLMLGYLNLESLNTTFETGKVTFFSRLKNRLWTKGETSGNYLELKSIALDCDADTLLIKAIPKGPICHTGSDTCFEEEIKDSSLAFLEAIIAERKKFGGEKSYTSSLFESGINKIAQKVGEEAVELIIEAKDQNKTQFLGEAADLLFHYLVLLQAKDYDLNEVITVLRERHTQKP